MLVIDLVAISFRYMKGGEHGAVCGVQEILDLLLAAPFDSIKSN